MLLDYDVPFELWRFRLHLCPSVKVIHLSEHTNDPNQYLPVYPWILRSHLYLQQHHLHYSPIDSSVLWAVCWNPPCKLRKITPHPPRLSLILKRSGALVLYFSWRSHRHNHAKAMLYKVRSHARRSEYICGNEYFQSVSCVSGALTWSFEWQKCILWLISSAVHCN